MILDSLRNKELYYPLCPRLKAAFEWLENTNTEQLQAGRHTIDGDDIFANVMQPQLKPREQAVIEVHDRYLDIQVLVTGDEEEFGWSPRHTLCKVRKQFDADSDVALYDDTPQTFYTMRKGEFCILLPQDGHAPMLGSGNVKKIIVKVKL